MKYKFLISEEEKISVLFLSKRFAYQDSKSKDGEGGTGGGSL